MQRPKFFTTKATMRALFILEHEGLFDDKKAQVLYNKEGQSSGIKCNLSFLYVNIHICIFIEQANRAHKI